MALPKELKDLFIRTANSLRGSACRIFMAGAVRFLGKGGQTLAHNELGWDRSTIRKGERELKSGEEIPDRRAGVKRKTFADKLPRLAEHILAVTEAWSQTDPRFHTTERYCRLSVSEVIDRLIEDFGYADRVLPSNETVRKMMRALGLRLRTVKKT